MPNMQNADLIRMRSQRAIAPVVMPTQGIPQPGQGQMMGMPGQQGPMGPPQMMQGAMPQLASFQPPPGQQQNPFMQQVLDPLMQANYGNPMVSPFGLQQGMPQQPGALPMPTPGLGGQQMPRPVFIGAQAQGLGQWNPESARSLRA